MTIKELILKYDHPEMVIYIQIEKYRNWDYSNDLEYYVESSNQKELTPLALNYELDEWGQYMVDHENHLYIQIQVEKGKEGEDYIITK